VRLVGSTRKYRRSTGELVSDDGSAQELDGFTYVRCGDRRAALCESCSREYKGDAWKTNSKLQSYYREHGFTPVRIVDRKHRGSGALFERDVSGAGATG